MLIITFEIFQFSSLQKYKKKRKGLNKMLNNLLKERLLMKIIDM